MMEFATSSLTRSHHDPVVAACGVNFSFGSGELAKQILFDVHLDIAPGEIVILTGPSGSGKTTLLSLIGALRSVKSGSLRVFDEELVGAPRGKLVRSRRRVGFIFQLHNLLPYLTAQQNVIMSLQLHPEIPSNEWPDRAAEMLDLVGLHDRRSYYPSALSVGQKQRVAIARALVSRPQLVLADEPTASLDGKTGRDVVNLMQSLAREQRSPLLMVTHDNRVLDIADRIIHMEDGRITDA